MRKRMIFVASVLSLLFVLAINGADIVLTITVNDTNLKAKAHVDDVADYTGWTAKIADPNNPSGPQIDNMSKKNWVEKKIKEWFQESLTAARANKKADKARADEIIAVKAEIQFK